MVFGAAPPTKPMRLRSAYVSIKKLRKHWSVGGFLKAGADCMQQVGDCFISAFSQVLQNYFPFFAIVHQKKDVFLVGNYLCDTLSLKYRIILSFMFEKVEGVKRRMHNIYGKMLITEFKSDSFACTLNWKGVFEITCTSFLGFGILKRRLRCDF